MTSGDRSSICLSASSVANSGGVPRNVRDQPADPGLDEPLPLFHKARDCFRDERLERRLMRDSPQGYCGGSPLPEAATRPPPGYANGGLHSMPPHERPENTRAKPVIGRPVPNCALAEQIVNRVQDRFGVQPRRQMLLNPNDPGQLVLAFPLPDQVGGQVQFRLRRPVPKGAAGPPGRNDSGDLRCPDSPILDCVLQVPFEPVACRRIRCSFESVLKIQNQWGRAERGSLIRDPRPRRVAAKMARSAWRGPANAVGRTAFPAANRSR